MTKAHRPTSSTKRIPVEADSAQEMPIASTSAFFQGSDGAKPTSKTLQDLPTELMEDVLVKAVVAEVRDQNKAKRARNKAKCTWKQKSMPVINRLSTVCTRWRDILKNKRFQLALQKHLGPSPLRLEVVANHQIESAVAVTTMDNEIFVLCHDKTNALNRNAFVNVYDRNDLWKVKHVIQLGLFCRRKPTEISACDRVKCLFVKSDYGPYIYAMEKRSEYEYREVFWKQLEIPTTISTFSMSAKKSLVVAATGLPSYIQEYNISMSKSRRNLKCTVDLREDILSMGKAIRKSKRNFVFQSLQSDDISRLLEIDAGGNIVHRLPLCDVPCYAVDKYDRIMIAGPHNMVRMLDEQFQEIQVFAPGDLWNHPSGLHYDQNADEWMLIDDGKYLTVVTIKQGKTTDDKKDFA